MENLVNLENLSLNDEEGDERLDGWLFECIGQRKLDPIRQMISHLALSERKTIISYHRSNTSLLAHAYVKKAIQIVKYFITECGADVNEPCLLDGKWLPPLYLAVKTGCIPMALLLLKFDAKDLWFDDDNRNAIVYACQSRNWTLAHILYMYGSDINSDKNIKLCISNINYCQRALELGTDVNHRTTSGNSPFMEAVLHGNYDLVKLLKSKNVDVYCRNNGGANALDLLVFNKKSKMISFLMSENLYTISDVIFSYEFCGAKKIFENDFVEGDRFWLTSKRLRSENCHSAIYETVPCCELLNLELEYDENAAVMTEKFRKAINIYLYLLSPQNTVTKQVFCNIALSGYYSDKNAFTFIKQLFRFNISEKLPQESVVSYAVRTSIKYAEYALSNPMRNLPEIRVNVFEELIDFTKIYMRPFLNEHTEQIPHYFSLYKYLLFVTLKYIDYFTGVQCDDEDYELVRLLIELHAPIYIKTYPTSLLLLAISRGFGLKVVMLLLECKSDVHTVDENLNTALHLVAQRPSDLPDRDKISMLLISAGCDVRAENIIGNAPIVYFKT